MSAERDAYLRLAEHRVVAELDGEVDARDVGGLVELADLRGDGDDAPRSGSTTTGRVNLTW